MSLPIHPTGMSNLIQTPCQFALAIFMTLSSFSLGCGPSLNSIPSATLSGQVTLDEKPIETGSINFIPVDGATPTAGAIIQQGKYVATVPLGQCRIEISAPKYVGKQNTYGANGGPEDDIVKEALPEKYNVKSELTHDVREDKRDLNFDLRSKS